MLDPRIYRTGFVAVVLAVIVFAFSLQSQPSALHTSLSPDQFDGGAAATTMHALAEAEPDRPPGSRSDRAVADAVAGDLRSLGSSFTVSTHTSRVSTVDGTRTLLTVTGTTPGTPGLAPIVIVAPRDGGRPAAASLSATAMLLELAQVIPSQTLNHPVMLVSISGSGGSAGAADLARQLAGRRLDGVIVLGDMVAAHPTQPVVVPWSNSRLLAPLQLRRTVVAALSAQTGISTGQPGVLAQLARLAFPLTLAPQGALDAAGEPAVTLSLSGEHGPAPDERPYPTSARISAMGQAILEAVDALDGGPAAIPASSSYLAFDGDQVPLWAIRLLAAALLLPVLLTAVDGVARASRRGHRLVRSVAWVLAAAVPFALAALLIRLAAVVSFLPATPPGASGPGAVTLDGAGIGLLAVVGVVVVLGLSLLRRAIIARAVPPPRPSRRRRAGAESPHEGAGPALLLVACVAGALIWAANPFAALLVAPALHVWLWAVDTDLHLPRPVAATMVLLGLVAPALVVAYYVHVFSLSAVGAVWSGTLLIAGGQIGVVALLLWSVVLGCFVSGMAIALARDRREVAAPDALSIRGPATYAGPGSLGGTNSAVRRS